MKTNSDELRLIFEALLEHLEESLGTSDFNISDDFYWSTPIESKYDPYAEPKELTLGQLSSDLNELRQIIENPEKRTSYGLVWLSEILKRIGSDTHHQLVDEAITNK
ncbi:MAG: hypothetical protein GY822_20775 [Deltaproteobacteria bacterium]|nr:hypothetical protein [Deltaproteobacteria bacterium]